MRFWFTAFTIVGTIAGWNAAFAGWGVGNPGGDNLGVIFTKAKQHAAAITLKVHSAALKTLTDQHTADWIITHKEKLAGDILASPHRRNEEENRTCAHTYFPEPTELDRLPVAKPIEIFFPTCRSSISNFEDATALLIHESVHHFNISSETFADKVAVAIVGAWKAGFVEWGLLPSSPNSLAYHSSVWTGDSLLVHGGVNAKGESTNELYQYSPDTQIWEKKSNQGAPEVHKHQAFWSEKSSTMLIWGGFKSKGSYLTWQNKGALYDAISGKWKTINNPYGPAVIEQSTTRFQASQQAVYTGQHLIIYGAELETGISGAIYSLATGKWQPLPTFQGAARASGHSLVYTGSSIILWGGSDQNMTPAKIGGIYNLNSREWTTMSSRNAPKATYAHKAIWTGEKMVVFGGFERSADFSGKGGVYDPSTNVWTPIKTQVAINRMYHSAVWTGKELLIYGGMPNRTRMIFATVAAFDPTTLKWRAISSKSQPQGRFGHSAVWTGSQMMIFGGFLQRGKVTGTGGIFFP